MIFLQRSVFIDLSPYGVARPREPRRSAASCPDGGPAGRAAEPAHPVCRLSSDGAAGAQPEIQREDPQRLFPQGWAGAGRASGHRAAVWHLRGGGKPVFHGLRLRRHHACRLLCHLRRDAARHALLPDGERLHRSAQHRADRTVQGRSRHPAGIPRGRDPRQVAARSEGYPQLLCARALRL